MISPAAENIPWLMTIMLPEFTPLISVVRNYPPESIIINFNEMK